MNPDQNPQNTNPAGGPAPVMPPAPEPTPPQQPPAPEGMPPVGGPDPSAMPPSSNKKSMMVLLAVVVLAVIVGVLAYVLI